MLCKVLAAQQHLDEYLRIKNSLNPHAQDILDDLEAQRLNMENPLAALNFEATQPTKMPKDHRYLLFLTLADIMLFLGSFFFMLVSSGAFKSPVSDHPEDMLPKVQTPNSKVLELKTGATVYVTDDGVGNFYVNMQPVRRENLIKTLLQKTNGDLKNSKIIMRTNDPVILALFDMRASGFDNTYVQPQRQ